MDRLMAVKEFIELRYTPESAPNIRTIQDRIKRGDLPGCKDGGTWMVNVSAIERGSASASNQNDVVDETLDRILRIA